MLLALRDNGTSFEFLNQTRKLAKLFKPFSVSSPRGQILEYFFAVLIKLPLFFYKCCGNFEYFATYLTGLLCLTSHENLRHPENQKFGLKFCMDAEFFQLPYQNLWMTEVGRIKDNIGGVRISFIKQV